MSVDDDLVLITVRVPRSVRRRAKSKAVAQGTTLTARLRAAVVEFVDGWPDGNQTDGSGDE